MRDTRLCHVTLFASARGSSSTFTGKSHPGALVAFTATFDEFALALFLSGADPTLPVFIYGQLRFASRLPMLISLAVLVMAGTLTLALIADRLRRRT